MRRDERQVLPRCNTRPAAEETVEMEFRQSGGRGDRCEPRLLPEVRIDVADGARDAREIAAVDEGVGSARVREVHARDDQRPRCCPRPDSCGAPSPWAGASSVTLA